MKFDKKNGASIATGNRGTYLIRTSEDDGKPILMQVATTARIFRGFDNEADAILAAVAIDGTVPPAGKAMAAHAG